MVWKVLWMILGIVSLFYGVAIFLTFSGSSFYLVWILLGILFFFFAYATTIHLWSMLPTILKSFLLIILVIGFALFLFVEGLIIKGFSYQIQDDVDYLIVLGAQVRRSGPSNVLRYRLDTASEYLHAHPNTICIVSGGQGSNEPFPEAQGMKDYLLQQGIQEERILMESTSKNTVENIHNSMQLFNPETDSVCIVTNNFHTYRGVALAKKAGIKHVSGLSSYSKLFYLPNNMVREFIGILKDFLLGNI